MNAADERTVRIPVSRLRPGIFISLSDHWLDHPFLFNEFRISNQKQIDTLREMGMEAVLAYPGRSTAKPLPAPAAPPPPPPPPPEPTAEELALAEARRLRIERIKASREQLARCEKAYGRTAGAIRNLMQHLHASPRQAAETAREVVSETVSNLLADQSVVLNLIGQKRGDDNAYFHALNVMILSLMLGKSESLSERDMQTLGMGSLFHDLGKIRVPDAVLKKGSERNKPEEDFYRLHTIYGEQIAEETGVINPGAQRIMMQHHEHLDGSGFPKGLSGDQIDVMARIVGLANRYDNLCNSPDTDGMTPAEALSQMFRNERHWWDNAMLQRFIKHLGVFPPGSIVQLSNGAIGLVFEVNHANPLKPSIMVYDKHIPRAEANIVDLEEAPDVSIEKAVRRNAVSEDVLEYLAPRRHVIYFYDNPASAAPH